MLRIKQNNDEEAGHLIWPNKAELNLLFKHVI